MGYIPLRIYPMGYIPMRTSPWDMSHGIYPTGYIPWVPWDISHGLYPHEDISLWDMSYGIYPMGYMGWYISMGIYPHGDISPWDMSHGIYLMGYIPWNISPWGYIPHGGIPATNGVAVRAPDAKPPAFCTELRCGSNGPPPGHISVHIFHTFWQIHTGFHTVSPL